MAHIHFFQLYFRNFSDIIAFSIQKDAPFYCVQDLQKSNIWVLFTCRTPVMSAMHQDTSPDLKVVANKLKDILEVYFNLVKFSDVILHHQNLVISHFFFAWISCLSFISLMELQFSSWFLVLHNVGWTQYTGSYFDFLITLESLQSWLRAGHFDSYEKLP